MLQGEAWFRAGALAPDETMEVVSAIAGVRKSERVVAGVLEGREV